MGIFTGKWYSNSSATTPIGFKKIHFVSGTMDTLYRKLNLVSGNVTSKYTMSSSTSFGMSNTVTMEARETYKTLSYTTIYSYEKYHYTHRSESWNPYNYAWEVVYQGPGGSPISDTHSGAGKAATIDFNLGEIPQSHPYSNSVINKTKTAPGGATSLREFWSICATATKCPDYLLVNSMAANVIYYLSNRPWDVKTTYMKTSRVIGSFTLPLVLTYSYPWERTGEAVGAVMASAANFWAGNRSSYGNGNNSSTWYSSLSNTSDPKISTDDRYKYYTQNYHTEFAVKDTYSTYTAIQAPAYNGSTLGTY